ncbi:hypothetical protein [Anaerorhabdus sp.]|uniref:hypothetical protein n=1 Tax=Anaerorhabdus sp. TaxID=1872524 RepID=UPI002FCBAE79
MSIKSKAFLDDKLDLNTNKQGPLNEIEITRNNALLGESQISGFQANKGASGAKAISKDDRAKIDKWKLTPGDELYLKYKDVYDNPKYFNQQTGNVKYPGEYGDIKKWFY